MPSYLRRQMMQCRPIVQLWPICTRLSILVPSPITVSPLPPRSIVVLAPISTLSWMMTRPSCGTLTWPLGARLVAKAVLPDVAAGVHDDAVADQRMHDRGARPDRAVAADLHVRPDHRVGADHGARADRRRAGRSPRRDRWSRRPRSRRSDARCARRHAVGIEQRTRPKRVRIKLPRHHDEIAERLAACSSTISAAGAPLANRSVVRQTPARVAASRSTYLALSRNVRSDGRARSSEAMSAMTRSSARARRAADERRSSAAISANASSPRWLRERTGRHAGADHIRWRRGGEGARPAKPARWWRRR